MAGFDDLDAAIGKMGTSPAGTPRGDDSLDIALAVQQESKKENLRSSMLNAQQFAPESYRRALQLARQTEIPAEVAARNLEEVERQTSLARSDRLLNESPFLASRLQDRNFAAAARDDIDNLQEVESVVRNLHRTELTSVARNVRGPEAGFASVVEGLANVLPQASRAVREGLRLQFADALGFDRMRQDAERRLAGVNLDRATTTPEFESATARGVYSGLDSTLRVIPGLTASLATRSSVPVLASMGLMTEAEAYGKYRMRGATPGEALTGAVGEGAVEVATEMIPMSFLVNRLGKVGTGEFLKGLLGREIWTEQLATAAQDAIDTAIANPEKTWADYAAERPEAAYQTLVATITQSSIMGGLNSALRRFGDQAELAYEAERDAEVLARLNAVAAASKLREGDPQTFQNFVQAAAEADGQAPTEIYIDAQALTNVLYQSGIDPAAILPPERQAELVQAADQGGDLVLPVGEYAATLAASEASGELLQHLRTAPDAMSMADAQAFAQQQDALAEEAARLAAEQQFAEGFRESAANVERELLDQLNAAGRFTPEVNRAYAQQLANFYMVYGSRLNLTPEEMYVRYPVRVSAGAPSNDVLSQSKPDIKPVEFDAAQRVQVVDLDGLLDDPPSNLFHRANEFFRETLQRRHADNPMLGKVYMSSLGRKKMLSVGRQNPLRMSVAKALPDLLANAVPYARVADRREHDNIIDYVYAVAPLRVEGKIYAVRLVMRESLQKDGPVFYTLEGFDVEGGVGAGRAKPPKPSPEQPSADTLSVEVTPSLVLEPGEGMAHDGDNLIVGDLVAAVNRGSRLFQEDQNATARGSFTPREFATDGAALISLLENADLSTFVHESGHFYLDVLSDIASQSDAPQQMVDDMNTLLQWFGVADLQTWNAMPLEEKRHYHEQLARGFEAYIFEGKAPNTALGDLFAKLRDWMIRVYKSLTSLNVSLTDEVRSVFDRMVATNEQIIQAEEARALMPLFETKPEGMSPEDWQEYQGLGTKATQEAVDYLQRRSLRDMRWLANAKSRVLKDLQKEAAARRREVEAEVRAEVEAEPIYRARRFILRGETVDPDTGETIKVEQGHRLNSEALKEMYPENMLARPDLGALRGMTSAEGLHPDVIADIFGFRSGDQLVRELLAAENMQEKIEGLTDQRMLERYGDITSLEALDRAANEAIHNEARLRFIATGYKAAANAVGPVRAIVAAAKAAAARTISAKRIKDLRPKQYEAAETRAGKAALKAINDPQALAVHTRNQLLNNALAKQAHEALREVETARDLFRRVITGKNEQLVKSRDLDIVNAARAILAEYGFAQRAKSAAEYLKAVESYDPALYNVLRDRVEAATANAKPFDQLTIDEMRQLRDEIASLWHLAKRSRQMEIDGDLLDREEVENALKDRIEEIGIPNTVPGEGKAVTDAERRVATLRSFAAALRRVESWVGAKDGDQPIGPFRKFIWQPVKEAADRYRADKAKYLKQYRQLLSTVAPTLKPQRIAAPELNYTFGYAKGGSGKAEILHALLHTGNDSNKRKLLLGRQWATEDAEGNLDTSRWDAFIDRMTREGVITKADYDFAQGVWDLLEAMKPQAQKAHRDVFGHYFNEVTAQGFNTPFGTYRGGYVPAMADPDVVTDAKTRSLAEEENQSLVYAFPATNRGFTKSRVEYNRPLLLDLRSLAQHIDKVLLFSHLEQPVRDVRRVLTSRTVSYGLNRIDPAAFDGVLTPWLNRAARQQVETPVAGAQGLMRFFSAARRNSGMAAMFANVVNTAQQITGFSIAAVKVQPRHMLSAMAHYARAPRGMARAVAEASPYMATRMENEVGQMTDAINEILLNPSVYEKAQNWTRRHAYFMQAAIDNVMSPIVWTAAYNQALEQGLSEADARRLGDSAVRETQGSTLPEDVSRIETGNAFVRMFTMFASYFNMQANLMGTEFAKIAQGMGLRKGMGRGLYVFTLAFLAPALISEIIVQAFRGGPEDEDKDGEYLDDWLSELFFGVIRAGTAMFPGVGPTINASINAFNNKPYDDRISTSPAISMIERAAQAGPMVYKAFTGENEMKPSRPIRDVATLISVTTGLPATAVARPLGYWADVSDDWVDPLGPVDAARGTITGFASYESRY